MRFRKIRIFLPKRLDRLWVICPSGRLVELGRELINSEWVGGRLLWPNVVIVIRPECLNGTRVTKRLCRLAFDKRVPSGCDLKCDGISLFGCVDERRDRQTPVEAHRPSLLDAAADETSNEAARHDRSGADCKLTSVERRSQNEAPLNYLGPTRFSNTSDAQASLPGNRSATRNRTAP